MSAATSLRVDLPPAGGKSDPVVRVRGFALACADRASRARAELDVAIDVLLAARAAAEASLERARCACDLAERVSVFAARAMAHDVDPRTLDDAANAIAELVKR